MREIHAYKCADGSIFENEAKAKAHEDDLIGQELDGFLMLFELDITRNQQFKGVLAAMKKRAAVLNAAKMIIHILEN